MARRSSNLKDYSLLTSFSLLEKVIAFIYQMIIAAVLGASIVTDCYFSASQLFDLIDSTLLGALVVVVINRYANICSEKDEKSGIDFLSRLNTLLSAVMVSLAVITFIFAKPFSYLIAPGFDEIARPELIRCIRILCVIPPIMVFATIAQGLLRLKKCFIVANSRSLFISMCGMAVILLFSIRNPENADVLCYGYVAANLLFSLLLFIRSRKFGKIGFKKPTFDSDTKKLLVMAAPAIISKGIVRISLMIDQVISSTLGEGSVSYLNYAHSLYNMVHSLLIVNLCVVMFTDFTNLCVGKQFDEMIKKLKASSSSILLILAPVSLLTMCFSKEIVSIAYQRGAFGEESSAAVGILLLFYAIGFIPAMLNSIHTQVLHSFGKMNIAMRNSIVSFILNIIISITVSHFIGIAGIAIGTTVSSIIVIPLYKSAVKKCLTEYKRLLEVRFILKLLAGLCACGAVIVPFKLFVNSPILSFGGATVCGFIAFAVTLILLKEETLCGLIKGIGKRKKDDQNTENTDQ
ncbi:MAG: polysaccharide biosynthesis protein [Clostridia bacterium]|nr:polysaccharide biosynthesis protein [Clostridia bacterium]